MLVITLIPSNCRGDEGRAADVEGQRRGLGGGHWTAILTLTCILSFTLMTLSTVTHANDTTDYCHSH